MSEVAINVNDRRYRLRCEAGQEGKLADLAKDIDTRLSPFAKRYGRVGDDRLMLLVALSLADELRDMQGKLEEATDQLAQSQKLRDISVKVLERGKDFDHENGATNQVDLEEVIETASDTDFAAEQSSAGPIELNGHEVADSDVEDEPEPSYSYA